MCEYVYRNKPRTGQACGAAKTKEVNFGSVMFRLCAMHAKSNKVKAAIERSGPQITEQEKVQNNFAELTAPPIIASEDIASFLDMQTSGRSGNRVNSSIWAITLNFNKTLESITPEEKLKIKTLASYLFIDINPDSDLPNLFAFILKDDSTPITRAELDNVKYDWAFEVGREQRRLHIHALVSIQHHLWIHFDFQIKNFMHEYLGWRPNFEAKIQKVATDHAWERYLNKNIESIEV